MSKTVDERVVSMQFDNKNFESNVRTSISTLDKLKEKLNFSGAAKGLDNLNAATKKVDMSHLGSAVETVRARFSAMEVVGVTALVNIANQAVNAGKRLVSSLTIDPIMDGFREYELTLNAVQTTMAATGKTAKEVEKELKKLDEYADKTVYSTADMINNLPKFTNAGVELEVATEAMIGIANATALAGGGASQAASAFYNLGQAIGTGYLTRVDFNSINNVAGIATVQWKEAMVEAAIAAGTLKKAGDNLYTAGNKNFTLQQLFIDGLQEQWATTDVLLKVLGDYGNEQTDIGKKAYEAATNIKTFTQMMESLKATAGTGWKDTWQLIFGDLDGAKKLWTGLTNFISGIITKMADVRNKFVEKVMTVTSPFSKLADKIGKVTEAAKPAAKTLEELNKVADRVIRGDFGNQWDFGDSQYRAKKLAEAGYEYAKVQNIVNEKLGINVRLTEDSKEAQAELKKEQGKSIEQLLKMSDAQLKKLGLNKDEIKSLRELQAESKKTGKSVGELLEEMSKAPTGRDLIIQSFKNLGEAIGKPLEKIKEAWTNTFDPITEEQIYKVISRIEELTEKLIMSDEAAENFKKVFEGIFALFKLSHSVFSMSVMSGLKILNAVLELFDLNLLSLAGHIAEYISKFADWVDEHTMFMNTADKIAKIIETVIRGIQKCVKTFTGLEVVQNIIKKVKDAIINFFGDVDLGIKGFGIDGIVEKVAKAFEKLNAWIASPGFSQGLKNFISNIKNVVTAIRDWLDSLKDSENLPYDIAQGIIKGFGKIVDGIKNAIKNMRNALTNGFDSVPGDLIAGFANGIWDGIKIAGQVIVELGKAILAKLRETLGIHSPSRETYGDGKNFVQGFVNGISDFAYKAWEAIKNFGSKIVDFFRNIDFGQIVAAGLTVGLTVALFKIVKILEVIVSPLENVNGILSATKNLINTFSENMTKLQKSMSLKLKAEAFKSIAIAIGILVASIAVLTLLDPKKMLIATGAIIALMGGLALVVSKLGKMDKGAETQLKAMSGMILSIGAAMLMLAAVIKIVGSMTWEELGRAGAGIAGLGIIIAGLIWATNLAGDDIDKVGGTLIKIGVAMFLMTTLIKLLVGMSWEELGRAGAGLAGLSVMVAALIFATKLAGDDIDKVGKTILAIGAAILLLTVTAKIIADMTWEDMGKAAVGLVGLGGIITGLIAATNLAGDDIDKVGKTILAVGAAMLLLTLTAKLIAEMDWDDMGKAAVGLVGLGGIITGLIAATRLAGEKELKRVASTLLAASVSIAILAGVAIVLSLISLEGLAKGIIAVSMLGAVMALMIYATKDAQDCQKTIMMMSIAIGVMAAAVVALSFIEPEKLAGATTALTILIGMFAIMAKAAGDIQSSMGSLIMMTVIVGVLAVIVYAISTLPVESTIGSAIALGSLMLAMSAVLFILSKIGASAAQAIIGVIALTTLVVPLLAFIGALAIMSHIENASTNAIVLAQMLIAFTAVLAALTLIGMAGPAALIGVASLTALVVPLVAIIGVLALMNCVENAATNAKLLMGLMTVMTTILVVLAVVGPLAMTGITAMNSLVILMGVVGVLATTIGFLMEKFPSLQQFLNTGIPVLEQLAHAIGSFVGNLVSGFMSGVTSDLPELGTRLSQFMTNLTPFLTGIKMVDSTVLEAVKTLASVVLLLTAADVLDGLTSWFTGGSSLNKFGSELAGLGTHLRTFVDNLGTFSDDQVATIDCASRAISAMAQAAQSIPKEGGWIAAICGDNGLAAFSSKLPQLGTDLGLFISNLGTFNEEQVAAAGCAGKAIKALADAATGIPKEGGWIAAILGDNSLASFGAKLPQVATYLKGFVTNLGAFTEEQVTTVTCAGNAIKALAEAAKDIPNDGGWIAAICGDNSLATFAEQLPGLGTNISNFVKNLGVITAEQVSAITNAVSAIKAFGEADTIADAGKNIKKFAKNMNDVDADEIATAATNLKAVVNAVKTISSVESEAVASFSTSLATLAKTSVDDFIEAFTGSASTATIKDAAKTLLTNFIDGAENNADEVEDAFEDLAKDAADSIESKSVYRSFKGAGEYVVDGFAEGITSNTFKAEAKATAMAKAALKAAKEALDEHSPSKEFYKIGAFGGQGFVNALGDYVSKSYRAGYEIAETARNGLAKCVSKITDIINNDIDAQPTIRPVLDLSAVEAGVGSIGTMFGNRATLGVSANIGAISSSMGGRQNGNADVVSAINKLRKELGNVGGTTNVIEGITYSDGTEVSDAIGTLVRAARIERRV